MTALFMKARNYATSLAPTVFIILMTLNWLNFPKIFIKFSIQLIFLITSEKTPEVFVKMCFLVYAVLIYFLFLYSFILWRLIFDSHPLVSPLLPMGWVEFNIGFFCSSIYAVVFRPSSTILILEGFVLSFRKTYRKHNEQTPSELFRIHVQSQIL